MQMFGQQEQSGGLGKTNGVQLVKQPAARATHSTALKNKFFFPGGKSSASQFFPLHPTTASSRFFVPFSFPSALAHTLESVVALCSLMRKQKHTDFVIPNCQRRPMQAITHR
jgi:hypothetical protein